jgi:16S rRNA G966 N2-methylase RsmD
MRPHVSLKKAWNATIRALRAARAQGHTTQLHSRHSVERLLDTELGDGMDAGGLKELLRLVLQGDSAMDAALAIDALTDPWLPILADGLVGVTIEGWPAWVPVSIRDEVVGFECAHARLPARAASAIRHHLEGVRIGGSQLKVGVSLGAEMTLPPVRREDRARNRHHSTKPWLPHLDELGRISATPRNLAEHHGELMATNRLVLDPFCGLGADAIGLALAGPTVRASDIDIGRVELAKQNAEHFGVGQQIEFTCMSVQEAIEALPNEPFGLFLDPPWGGEAWDRDNMNLQQWIGEWPFLIQAIRTAAEVVLKLPRSFDVKSLEPIGRKWHLTIGLGPQHDAPSDRIRLITAYSPTTEH